MAGSRVNASSVSMKGRDLHVPSTGSARWVAPQSAECTISSLVGVGSAEEVRVGGGGLERVFCGMRTAERGQRRLDSTRTTSLCPNQWIWIQWIQRCCGLEHRVVVTDRYALIDHLAEHGSKASDTSGTHAMSPRPRRRGCPRCVHPWYHRYSWWPAYGRRVRKRALRFPRCGGAPRQWIPPVL